MAAALLQQLQQQNPALLQNLVGQHCFVNSAPNPQVNNTSRVPNAQQFKSNGDNAVKCTAVPQSPSVQKLHLGGIPAPPLPHNAIHRKNTNETPSLVSTTHRRSTLSNSENGWPTTSSSNGDQEPDCENKENGGQDPPVWVMRYVSYWLFQSNSFQRYISKTNGKRSK